MNVDDLLKSAPTITLAALDKTKPCVYAAQFGQWAASLVAEVEAKPTGIVLHMAYVQLQHRYFDWRMTVPLSHRNQVLRTKHYCIFHVFDDAYHRLRTLELSLPAVLALYQDQVPASSVPGLYIGDDDEDV